MPKPEKTAHALPAASDDRGAEAVVAALRQDLAGTREDLVRAAAEIHRLGQQLEKQAAASLAQVETLKAAHATALREVNAALSQNIDRLQTSEARFKSLVSTIPDIVYRIDADGVFVFLNEAVQLLGYAPEELIGRHFSDILLPGDVEQVCRAQALTKPAPPGSADTPKLFDERRSGARRTKGLEVKLVAKDAAARCRDAAQPGDEKIVFVEVNSSGVYERGADAHKPVFRGTVGVIRDISGRKKAEKDLIESESRLKTILSCTEAGIMVIDPGTHTIVDVNPAAARLIGAPAETILGQACHRFICSDADASCPRDDEKCLTAPSEETLTRVDGGTLTVLKTLTPLLLRGKRHLLESFIDITQMKRAQEALRQTHDQLEATVEARTLALKKTNRRLQEEIVQRKQAEQRLTASMAQLRASQAQLIMAEKTGTLGVLSAGIAHELNNPLMGILNFIEYCIRHTDAADRRYAVLQDAAGEIHRCIDIVKDLLTFCRIGSDASEIRQSHALEDLIRRGLGLLNHRITATGVRVSLQGDAALRAPVVVSTIQQVFINLLGNALDALAGTASGKITIDIHRSGDWAEVAITDNGPGIPENHRSKIFEPFYTTKPAGKGTGLGLYFSRCVANEHGGRLICRNPGGTGTTFALQLPLTVTKKDALT